MSKSWAVLAEDGSVLDRFDSSEEAYEATYEGGYPDDNVEVAYIADPLAGWRSDVDTTTPVLVPLTYWSNGNGITHQIRRLMYVHTPGSAEPSRGTRTLCGQEVAYLHPSFLGEGTPCKVCEAGGSNEIALIHSGLGTRWVLPERAPANVFEVDVFLDLVSQAKRARDESGSNDEEIAALWAAVDYAETVFTASEEVIVR